MRLGLLFFMFLQAGFLQAQKYLTDSGKVSFTSDAPLELIEAESEVLKGILDVASKEFGFKLSVFSFEGFNSPQQQTHFYENYMEANKYQEATFQGKIIEAINLKKIGLYRAKGQLEIHGIGREVIIDVWIRPEKDKLIFESHFNVFLSDYEIDLPRIVYQKIAERIDIHVVGALKQEE